ncbi:unnamed protein product [Penicillium pancosmium]
MEDRYVGHLVQTVEGTLENIANRVMRVRQIVSQSASNVLTKSDRNKLQLEVDELVTDIQHEIDTAQFRGEKLFDSCGETTFKFKSGSNSGQVKIIRVCLDISVIKDKLESIVLEKTGDAMDDSSLEEMDQVINNLSEAKAILAAQQNSLQESRKRGMED